ncbi:hypothetical protein [Flavobacterium soli]|uniref:hypothetical protein n=1 Tax=Flavobacterium soli TaxID=344881 RepID=UPI0012F8A5EC|nr:hypothetical protein [Flavobacterium soli]
MRVILYLILLIALQSCATKKDTRKQLLPDGIQSATEERYEIVGNQKKLLTKKEMVFTKNGRIKSSKTVDASGKIVQETKKKLWFVEEIYPDKEKLYRKTRWKPNQRERISTYEKKRDKASESIYHYNKDGTIAKIVDNLKSFETQYFYYSDNELTKIVTKDKEGNVIDEVMISCTEKDEKGTCLKQTRTSAQKKYKEEVLFTPVYGGDRILLLY